MTNVHPHWQTTDDAGEQPVRISVTEKITDAQQVMLETQKRVQIASRKPAAFVGIMLFVIFGFATLNGYLSFHDITADVTTTNDIHISESSVTPNEVNVRPGETITWVNDDSIPHIMAFDTLLDTNGSPLLSSPIFPQGRVEMTIPSTTPEGTYTFVSKTSGAISGDVVVSGTAIASTTVTDSGLIPPSPIAAQQTSSFRSQRSSAPLATTTTAANSNAGVTSGNVPLTDADIPTVDTGNMFANDSLTTTDTTNTDATDTPHGAPTAALLADINIPTNTHTIGNETTQSNNMQYEQDSQPLISTLQRKPTREPASGPALWVTTALAIGVMGYMSRKQLFSK